MITPLAHARPSDTAQPQNIRPALTVGFSALVGFAAIVTVVVTRRVSGIDDRVLAWVDAHQSHAVHQAFFALSWMAGIVTMRVIAVIGAVAFWFSGRRRAAGALAAALIAATLFYEFVKRFVERARPPAGYALDPTFAFPSGHATVSVAVCCALAYVAWRERLVTRSIALGVAIAVPLFVGLSRIYLEMHWTTDVIGGWCAGIAVACAAAVLYEMMMSSPRTHSP